MISQYLNFSDYELGKEWTWSAVRELADWAMLVACMLIEMDIGLQSIALQAAIATRS